MIRRLYPFEPERAHCRRVAAWAWLIARREGLDPSLLPILERTALLHHAPGLALSGEAVGRLLAEMETPPGEAGPVSSASADGSEALAAALREACASSPGPRAAPLPRLFQLLEAAHVFDECLEALPYEFRPLAELLDDAVSLSPDPAWTPLLDVFRQPVLFEGEVLAASLAAIPVNPEVVAAVAEVAGDENSELADLERVTGKDPALAAALLKAANSARQALRHPISTLTQAINQLGLDESRQVLTAMALRRAFVAPAARPLWPHSLELASLASSIGGKVAHLAPPEAFLGGLLHDFGRLLLLAAPAPLLGSYTGLLERGCPPVTAELALCGIDHAEIGARVLESWGLAETVCEAVRQHHRSQPGIGALGALLQLCEEIAGAGEDLPSLPRLRDSLRTLHLPAGILADAQPALPTALKALRGES